MNRRVTVCGLAKSLRDGAEAKASLNRATMSQAVDPNLRDLPMDRMKRP